MHYNLCKCELSGRREREREKISNIRKRKGTSAWNSFSRVYFRLQTSELQTRKINLSYRYDVFLRRDFLIGSYKRCSHEAFSLCNIY